MIGKALVLSFLPAAAAALSLDLPVGAESTHAEAAAGTAVVPVGAFRDGAVPTETYRGRVTRQVWRIPGEASTFDLTAPIQAQLAAEGYTVVASCAARECGGFDFRFAIEVVEEPDMHVDIGDFRYLAAERKAADGTEAVSLLVSRSDLAGFLQITTVEPGAGPPGPAAGGHVGISVDVAVPDLPDPDFDPSSLIGQLETRGHIVLDDLELRLGVVGSRRRQLRIAADAGRLSARPSESDGGGGGPYRRGRRS